MTFGQVPNPQQFKQEGWTQCRCGERVASVRALPHPSTKSIPVVCEFCPSCDRLEFMGSS